MTLFDPEPREAVKLEPVFVEVVRECHYERKPCGLCGLPKSNRAHTPKKTATCRFQRRLGCARCGKAKTNRSHFGEPPSLNVLGSGDPRTYIALKESWQAVLATELAAAGLPRGLDRVLVEGEAVFPTAQRRDQGNHRALIEKALGDALVHGGGEVPGGWLEDDDWSRYEFGNLVRVDRPGVSATRLMIFPTLYAGG